LTHYTNDFSEDLKNKISLKLMETRKFGNGNKLLKYEPVR